MEDKVISEFKVVETEDGFRIEIKGDKEKLRPFIENMPFGRGFGPRGGRHWKRRMRNKMRMRAHGFGPHHHGHQGSPPDWWWGPEEKQDDNPASRDVPSANV